MPKTGDKGWSLLGGTCETTSSTSLCGSVSVGQIVSRELAWSAPHQASYPGGSSRYAATARIGPPT